MRVQSVYNFLRAGLGGGPPGTGLLLPLATQDHAIHVQMDCTQPRMDFSGSRGLEDSNGTNKSRLLYKIAFRDWYNSRTDRVVNYRLTLHWKKEKKGAPLLPRRGGHWLKLLQMPLFLNDLSMSNFGFVCKLLQSATTFSNDFGDWFFIAVFTFFRGMDVTSKLGHRRKARVFSDPMQKNIVSL